MGGGRVKVQLRRSVKGRGDCVFTSRAPSRDILKEGSGHDPRRGVPGIITRFHGERSNGNLDNGPRGNVGQMTTRGNELRTDNYGRSRARNIKPLVDIPKVSGRDVPIERVVTISLH